MATSGLLQASVGPLSFRLRGLLARRGALGPSMCAGLLLSFLYFRLWALYALRGQPLFVAKWCLGLAYDVAAWGAFCIALSWAWSLFERPVRWTKLFALFLVFLNWGNFEVARHIGQPFLPQALSVVSIGDAVGSYGGQLIWNLLHPGHFFFAGVVPGVLVLLSRPSVRGEHAGSGVPWLTLGTVTFGVVVPALIIRSSPAATAAPRALTWNFYGHGAFHWAAFLWRGDEAAAGGETPDPLTLEEFHEVSVTAKRYLDDDCTEWLSDKYPLFRRTGACASQRNSRPAVLHAANSFNRQNVVLVHLESFRAASFDGLSHVWSGITPRLGALMHKSAHFTRAFTNNLPTDRSLTSMLCSVPVPNVALSRMDRPRPRIRCLPQIMRDAGYRTVRMSGIPSGFQKLGEFFAHYGMDETFGSEELEAMFPNPDLERLGEGGYDARMLYDERLLYAARAWIGKHRSERQGEPFLMLLETMTNHLPWQLPQSSVMPLERYRALRMGEEQTGTTETTRLHRTMRLTDDYVADFVDWLWAQEDGELARETLLVFYSDHPPWFPEPDFARYPQVVKESWIPLFIWGVQPELVRAFHHPVSLLDVAPTLLRLTGVSGAHSFVGKDLLDERAERWFGFSQPEGRAYFAAGEHWELGDGTQVTLRSDMTFAPARDATVAVGQGSGSTRRASWDLLERFIHRSLLADRAVTP